MTFQFYPRHARGRADFLVLRTRPEYHLSIRPRPCEDSAQCDPGREFTYEIFQSHPAFCGENATQFEDCQTLGRF
jgi:hypothetical protein